MKRTALHRKTPLRAKKGMEQRERKVYSFGGGPKVPKRTLRKRRTRPTATTAEKAHLGMVAKMGCIACRQNGIYQAACIHHIRTGYGTGWRASHWEVIPLCSKHHQYGGAGVAFHAAPRTWMGKFGTEIALLVEVYRTLCIPFEKLVELRGGEPPWWQRWLDGSALVSPASVIFDVEDEDE